MRPSKTTLRFFTIADWEKEEQYLREMHTKGWALRSGGIIYHFERCRPEDVVYRLDYNQEGRKNKDEYIRLFEDCGWEYVQDFAGYSYFRKPVHAMESENEDIFCDDASRLEMVRHVIRGRMLPLLVIFLLFILPQAFWHVYPINGNVLITFVLWCMVGLYMTTFAILSLKFWDLSKRYR